MRFVNLFLIGTFLVVASLTAEAAPVKRLFQDVKLPTQKVMEHYSWALPSGASVPYVLSAHAGNTASTAVTVTTFANQPDYARNLTVLPIDNPGTSINACTLVINGTNINGASISESFVISSGSSAAKTGSKAFKTVTSVVFPFECEKSPFAVTWSVGIGTKLGVDRCTDSAGDYVFSIFNSAYESTRGTFASNSSTVESNTFIPNGSMDSTKPVELFYVQNYGCFP